MMKNELFDYSPIIERPKIEWPGGKQLAFYIGLNVEHYEIGKPATSIFPGTASLAPDPLNYGWRDYGARVGIWRVMKLLDQYKMRASVLLNSDVCEHCPQIIKEGNKRNWAWLAHGKNNSTLQANMSYEEEEKYLYNVVEAIQKGTGKDPKGWLGPALTETFNTPEILVSLDLNYLLDWCNDDQPYPLNVGSHKMISVPYSIEVNDIPLFVGTSFNGWDFVRLVQDQINTLYREGGGRVACVALHPFIIGQPFRIKYLEEVLEYVAQNNDIWVTTSDEIADWYMKHYYK